MPKSEKDEALLYINSIRARDLPQVSTNEIQADETLVQPTHFYDLDSVDLEQDLVSCEGEKLLRLNAEQIAGPILDLADVDTRNMDEDEFFDHNQGVKNAVSILVNNIKSEIGLMNVGNLAQLYEKPEEREELQAAITFLHQKLNFFSRYVLNQLRQVIIQYISPEELEKSFSHIQKQYDLIKDQTQILLDMHKVEDLIDFDLDQISQTEYAFRAEQTRQTLTQMFERLTSEMDEMHESIRTLPFEDPHEMDQQINQMNTKLDFFDFILDKFEGVINQFLPDQYQAIKDNVQRQRQENRDQLT